MITPTTHKHAIKMIRQFIHQDSALDKADYGVEKGQRRDSASWESYYADLRTINANKTRALNELSVFKDSAWKPDVFETVFKNSRIEFKETTIHYTTGQYFPVEFNAVMARLLEQYNRAVKPRIAPGLKTFTSVLEIERANEDSGGHFFDESAKRFFNSRILPCVYAGRVFITSERFDYKSPRRYTVRMIDTDGDIQSLSPFNKMTLYKARQTAERLGRGAAAVLFHVTRDTDNDSIIWRIEIARPTKRGTQRGYYRSQTTSASWARLLRVLNVTQTPTNESMMIWK